MNLLAREPVPFDVNNPGAYPQDQLDVRSPDSESNVHVSTILAYIAQKIKRSEWDDEFFEQRHIRLRAMMGFLWEEWIDRANADVKVHEGSENEGGELKYRNIVGSPDGFSFDDSDDSYTCDENPAGWMLEEFKVTWLGSQHDPESGGGMWGKWLDQVRAYLRMEFGDDPMPEKMRVRFWVLFINGDYKDERPIAERFVLEFSKREVERLWAALEAYRQPAIEWHMQGRP